MGIVKDIQGEKYGRLTVIERDFNTHTNNKAYWFCRCSCGKIISVRGQDLRQGKTKSCGCYNLEKIVERNLKDLTGQTFGWLTAIESTGIKDHRQQWKCKCKCGNTAIVSSTHLLSGITKSCGCLVSFGENIISNIFNEHNVPYKRQYTFPDLKGENNTTRLRFDFAIIKNDQLYGLIEFQGEQHFTPFKRDTEETFQRRLLYDQKKRDYCAIHHIPLIEINYSDRLNIDWPYLREVLIKILREYIISQNECAWAN